MELILYKTLDAENVIGKTLTEPRSVNISFRRETNIVSPVITLTRVPEIELRDFNYAYIVELERYYFIRSVDFMNSRLLVFELESDLLETFKADILSSHAKVSRVIKAGDYGPTELDLTGEVDISDYISDVELEPFDNSLLTVLRWA